MKHAFAVPFAAAAMLAACASQPDYRPASAAGGEGYSSQQIESNRYRVSYTGDEHQSAQTVRDYALLRAAELTMEEGGDWFEVLRSETAGDTETRTRFENRGFETRTAYRTDCGLLGCTTRAEPVTTFGGTDRVEETQTVFDHSMEIVIHEGEKPAGNPAAYHAAETAANLRASLD